jgi:multidrug efflux system membrane fusion protein
VAQVLEQGKARMRGRERVQLVGAVAAASLCVLGAAACAAPASPGQKKPVPVKVRVIEKGGAGLEARYSGTLEPNSRVDMAFRVGGYVEAIAEIKTADGARALDKGDRVNKGAFLARLRSADYAQRLATTKAALAEASSAAKLAEQESERARKLHEANVASSAEYEVAQARLESAKATVEGATGRMNEAALSLVDTVLHAPMDGIVLSRSIENGSLVSPGSPAFSLADTRSVKAVFGAPQSLVERLRVGSPLTVYLGAEGSEASDKPIAAQCTRIAPAAESSGRVFSVEASLPNENGALRPGSVVSVRVPEVALESPSLVVPLSAVVRSPRDPQGFSVFVLDGAGERARAKLHDVHLGDVRGNGASVIDGLALGDRVVTRGATLLNDGDDAVVIR